MQDGKLEKGDMELLRLPKEFWHTTRDKIPEEVGTPLNRYMDDLKQMKKDGVSLLFTGPPGTGKSGAASVILKYARSRGFDCYWRFAWQYREDRRSGRMYNADVSSFDRCLHVPFLVIDDFREEDATDRYYGTHDFEGLLISRAQNRLPTILTSSFDTEDPAIGLGRLRVKVTRFVEIVFGVGDLRSPDARVFEDKLWGDNA